MIDQSSSRSEEHREPESSLHPNAQFESDGPPRVNKKFESGLTPPPDAPPVSDGTHQPDKRRARTYYLISATISLIFLALIAYIWYRVYSPPVEVLPGETMVTGAAQMNAYLAKNNPPLDAEEPPIYIPTGIVLQSVEFKGPYTLQLGGYIWQRYADNLPPDIDRGVVLPEAESTTFTKVYETHQDKETLIGWNFKATVREQFDYSKYPLDSQQIWVRLWATDFEKNVFLEPDIAGYTTLNPASLPGLDPNIVLENWQILQSFFSFRLNTYNSTFGISGYNPTDPQPEMYFNVSIQRSILGALISRLLAPLVILLQLFVIVMVIGTDHARLEAFGVRPGAVIFTCAAFFFAILLAQNALRAEIQYYGIVYFEALYLITYIAILAVAANSVSLVAFPDLGLFRDNDNLWVEVLYWPIITGSMLLITYFVFRSILY